MALLAEKSGLSLRAIGAELATCEVKLSDPPFHIFRERNAAFTRYWRATGWQMRAGGPGDVEKMLHFGDSGIRGGET